MAKHDHGVFVAHFPFVEVPIDLWAKRYGPGVAVEVQSLNAPSGPGGCRFLEHSRGDAAAPLFASRIPVMSTSRFYLLRSR